LIADDHAILREGLISLIEKQSDVTVVGEAREGDEALSQADLLEPDVVVMDIKMGGLSGIDACQRLKQGHPDTHVIMLSMYDDYEYVEQALHVGADGYLLKEVISSELVDAIRRVADGEQVFCSQVLRMITDSFRDKGLDEASPLHTLTEREMEVLKLLADGLRNKQIAAQMFLSTKTVERLLSDIYRKLGVGSRVAAIKLFLESRP
jgi:DNA-binding NarL/FixJ family response regulator